MIGDHWFRADYADEPCVLTGCGRPQDEHVESVGEWMDARHWFVPSLRHPSRCGGCGRMFAHSTHHGSKKNRSLHHSQFFWRWRDRLLRRELCRHLSHRVKLPCLRLVQSCCGLCEDHCDACHEGCP